MTEAQKAKKIKDDEEQAANQIKADNMIKDAEDRLERVKAQAAAAYTEVEEMREKNIEKQAELDEENDRTNQIEQEHKDDLEQLKKSRIGEIFWLIRESQEDPDERDNYYFIIHSFLVELFIEDHGEDDLKEDIDEKID